METQKATPASKRVYLRDGRAPIPRNEATSRVMSANRAKDTAPERALLVEIRKLGLRGYRLHRQGVPGRPDVAFGARKVAVFVNGCYWHSCPRCQLPLPRTHTEFWRAKFEANRRRDAQKSMALERAGWRVLTLWECEIREDSSKVAERVAQLLRFTTPHRGPGETVVPQRQSESR